MTRENLLLMMGVLITCTLACLAIAHGYGWEVGGY
jgi:hypothetical protein